MRQRRDSSSGLPTLSSVEADVDKDAFDAIPAEAEEEGPADSAPPKDRHPGRDTELLVCEDRHPRI